MKILLLDYFSVKKPNRHFKMKRIKFSIQQLNPCLMTICERITSNHQKRSIFANSYSKYNLKLMVFLIFLLS